MQDLSKPRLTYSSRELSKLWDSILHNNKYRVLNPGAISNICTHKINTTKISTSQRHVKQPRGVNKSNLKYIRTVNFGDKDLKPNIRIATANARSVKNKDQIIVQQLNNNDIDVALITETWTKDTQENLTWLNQSELCQGHYEISTHNRPGETWGGGIALIFGKNDNMTFLEKGNTPTLEYAIWRYTIRNKPLHIIRIYHPPHKGKHSTTNRMFIDDITELLTNKLPQYQNSILLGDFNIHIEDQMNVDAVMFNETMRALSLEQHVLGPTHVTGNTLDLIFTQLSKSFNITNTTLHGYISDHCMVSVDINIKKQKYTIETKEKRDRTKLTGPALAQNFTPQILMKTQPSMKLPVNWTQNCTRH